MATSSNAVAEEPSSSSGNRHARRQEKFRIRKPSKEGTPQPPRGSDKPGSNGDAVEPISFLGAAGRSSEASGSTSKVTTGESVSHVADIKGKGKAVEMNFVKQSVDFADGDEFVAFDFPNDFENQDSNKTKDEERSRHAKDDHSDDERHRRSRKHDTREDRRSSNPHFDREKDEKGRWRDDEGEKPLRRRRESDGRGDARPPSKHMQRKCPWIQDVDLERCPNVAELMHREVESFVDWVSPTPVEDEIRGLIVEHISRIVQKSFPDAQVYPFGSYQTKLYLPEGDIDLVIISDSMAYSDKTTVLHVLANSLKRGGITSHVTIIAKARVPIVKFTSKYGRFKVDISINQQNGLVSGNIIMGFLRGMVPSHDTNSESKALRSLVMITKAFLSQRGMNEVYTGGLGSYSVVCLAVSFLQMHPKIRRGEIDPEKNLGVLVMEFFELYGWRFNYDEVGISLREGGTYFSKRQRGWHADYKRNMLCVEDPADPTNDISSGSYNFHKVKTAFAGAYGILTSTAYLRAGMLSSRHHGRSVRLRNEYHPEDLSMLSTVMGITQETINHRRLVQELYDDRTMHKVLNVHPAVPVTVATDNSRMNGRPTPTPSKAETRSAGVKRAHNDAIKEATYDPDDSDDPSRTIKSFGRRDDEGDEDDEGRYGIGRRPPKKRRRTGKDIDSHTVVFVDGDEHEEGEYASDDSLDEPILTSGKKTTRSAPNGSDKAEERRSFWLSKGGE